MWTIPVCLDICLHRKMLLGISILNIMLSIPQLAYYITISSAGALTGIFTGFTNNTIQYCDTWSSLLSYDSKYQINVYKFNFIHFMSLRSYVIPYCSIRYEGQVLILLRKSITV